MSNRWPGGIIRKTPVTPTGPFASGAASGVWSLADAAYWTKQGLWPLASSFAVEDVFSTWLYTGNGSTQTITNGIDLAGGGGLIWLKNRSSTAGNVIASHALYDTVRGIGAIDYVLRTDTTAAQNGIAAISSVNSDGFTFGGGNQASGGNNSGDNYASWTFREAPKFFDVVTWTGNGTNQFINHNLGVTPGFVIYKATSTTSDWFTLARGSDGNYSGLRLNLTNQADITGFSASGAGLTSTTFNPNAIYGNTNGVQYVAYLFAHDTASTGLIQCGSYTGNGGAAGPVVTLGWEPQWVLVKNASSTGNWQLLDNMRGLPVGFADATLQANLNSAESSVDYVTPTATGFQVVSISSEVNNSGNTYVYMAIRRGPMKTPTLGTTVFSPVAAAGSQGTNLTTGFPIDLQIQNIRTGAGFNTGVTDRLRAVNTTTSGGVSSGKLTTTNSTQENSIENTQGWNNTGFSISQVLGVSQSLIYWNFRRAPGFFDEVCYTGTNVTGQAFAHNLGVVPELIIAKARSTSSSWGVAASLLGWTNGLYINTTGAIGSPGWFATPTSTTFVAGGSNTFNTSGTTYVAYLFASCPGVSKVGTYTGTGALQTIDCAFTTGARFVLIKRTDSTGDWFVWDSARGISSGNDPYSLLNSTAAETTGTNFVDTTSVGFQVTAAAPAGINASGGTYLFLAIA